ncbi:hypothetical protein K8P10_000200 [Leucobacter sp. Psy1]|uniref:hypothetical protein n=1 Tax=Leucobacter sp. Psy1 TaxID=2875729 RepID=UPI001CD7B348|nr:hypothetical protein [Leucobacter sp. Psy1]UBH04689.1 hypothetical protein K8P10_000200 [Leucobacter sp. Psy1]
MTTSPNPTLTAENAMARFDAQTTRYGSITMIAGLILSLAGPFYLLFFGGLDLSWPMIWTAFIAVAATFGVFWIVEPVTYFPVLGPAAMYQAFMIGNISNKLLPAAIVAQSSIDAKPGTSRGNIASVMAICGAATVHLLSLLIFVGVLGTWLISMIPPDLIEVARLYILPSLMGAVLVQCIVSMKQLRPTIVALALALIVQFGVILVAPAVAPYATAIVVISSIVISWLVRDRKKTSGGTLN